MQLSTQITTILRPAMKTALALYNKFNGSTKVSDKNLDQAIDKCKKK